MITINFERWGTAAIGNKLYKRWYFKGWRWTPFVIVTKRYKGATK